MSIINTDINFHINKLFRMVSKSNNTIVISGSACIYSYITSLGYDDLLVGFNDPNDVDFLGFVSNRVSLIYSTNIGTYTTTNIGERSVIFKNNKEFFKNFSLTNVHPYNYNIVNGINLINIKEYY